MTTTLSGALLEALSERSIVARFPHLLALLATGPDAPRYLQNRLTQQLENLTLGDTAQTLVLTSQAKIEAACLIVRAEESFLLLADSLPMFSAQSFREAILRFKVSDRIEAESVCEQHSLITIQGAAAEQTLRAALPDLATDRRGIWHDYTSGKIMLFPHPRLSPEGIDLLVTSDIASALEERLVADAQLVTGEEFEALRIYSGIPRFSVDFTERTLAPELPLNPFVSFSKGCYPGQEVIERSLALGRAPRKLVQLFAATSSPPEGREVIAAGSGECGGTVSSACFLAERNEWYALATLKNSYLDASDLTVGTTPVVVTTLAD